MDESVRERAIVDGGLLGILLPLGVCALVFGGSCWLAASYMLRRIAQPWLGFLVVGASALLVSLGSYGLLMRLVVARATLRRCLDCGLALAPYGLGVDVTVLATLSIAGAGCAIAARTSYRRRWWAVALLLVLGAALPPVVVVGYVLGPVQPLMGSGYNVEFVLIGQSLLVLLFGIGLRFLTRPDATMAGDARTEEATETGR